MPVSRSSSSDSGPVHRREQQEQDTRSPPRSRRRGCGRARRPGHGLALEDVLDGRRPARPSRSASSRSCRSPSSSRAELVLLLRRRASRTRPREPPATPPSATSGSAAKYACCTRPTSMRAATALRGRPRPADRGPAEAADVARAARARAHDEADVGRARDARAREPRPAQGPGRPARQRGSRRRRAAAGADVVASAPRRPARP